MTVQKMERMAVEQARELMAKSLGEYVTAKSTVDRNALGEQYSLVRSAFRQTYGVEEWRRSFDQVLDEGLLEYFVYDREALRDG